MKYINKQLATYCRIFMSELTTNKKPNEYALISLKREHSTPNDKEGTLVFQPITFYEMFEDGTYDNGTTLEEMLRVSFERLSFLNSKFPCEENEEAMKHIEEAKKSLDKRTADRKARGVEGKHEA